jgi:uncharacterized protein RhaS with RHS repeats
MVKRSHEKVGNYLTGISYDKAGNLTTLQRYGQGATLLDNVTYTLAATSNRLG